MKNNNKMVVNNPITNTIVNAVTELEVNQSSLELLAQTQPDDDSFKEKFDNFLENECVYVGPEVFTCNYCNSSLTSHIYVDTMKNNPILKDLQGASFCDEECLEANIKREMVLNGLVKNPKLDMEYLYKFDSVSAKVLLKTFSKEELLKFADEGINTYLFESEGWKDDYKTKDEIPKELLIEEIIEHCWDI